MHSLFSDWSFSKRVCSPLCKFITRSLWDLFVSLAVYAAGSTLAMPSVVLSSFLVFLFPCVLHSKPTLTVVCLKGCLKSFCCIMQHCQLPVLDSPDFLLMSSKNYKNALKQKLFLTFWKVSSSTLGSCIPIAQCAYVPSFSTKLKFSYLNIDNSCKIRNLVIVCIFSS